MTLELWTLAIAIITALACAISGVFLVVKREALVSEGLSHAVLPGIIVGYIVLRDRSTPLLIVSAAAMGLLMVLLVKALERTRLVDSDASLGIVFAALFSVGIILANLELKNTHFHAHCIIDGNLALAPLNDLKVGSVSLGPKSFYTMLGVLIVLIGAVLVCFKELKIAIFDPSLARTLGFRPELLHVCWLALVSLTTVAAFDTAGSILVVALMITPPAAAFLLTNRLSVMLVLSSLIGAACAVIGFYLGLWMDIAPTGPMAAVAGLLFLLVLVFAPTRGLYSQWRIRVQQRSTLFQHLLLQHLADPDDNGITQANLAEQFHWSKSQFDAVLHRARALQLIEVSEEGISLTHAGEASLLKLNAEI